LGLLWPIINGLKRLFSTVTPSMRFDDSALSINAISTSDFKTCGDWLA
jgi:hypothetical protein